VLYAGVHRIKTNMGVRRLGEEMEKRGFRRAHSGGTQWTGLRLKTQDDIDLEKKWALKPDGDSQT